MQILQSILNDRIHQIIQMRQIYPLITISEPEQIKKWRSLFIKYKKNQIMRNTSQNEVISYISKQIKLAQTIYQQLIKICRNGFSQLHSIEFTQRRMDISKVELSDLIKLFIRHYELTEDKKKQCGLRLIIQNYEAYDQNLLILTLLNLFVDSIKLQFHKMLPKVLEKIQKYTQQNDKQFYIHKKSFEKSTQLITNHSLDQQKLRTSKLIFIKNIKNLHNQFTLLFGYQLNTYYSILSSSFSDLDNRYYKYKQKRINSNTQQWLQQNLNNLVASAIEFNNSHIKNSLDSYTNSINKFRKEKKQMNSMDIFKIRQKQSRKNNDMVRCERRKPLTQIHNTLTLRRLQKLNENIILYNNIKLDKKMNVGIINMPMFKQESIYTIQNKYNSMIQNNQNLSIHQNLIKQDKKMKGIFRNGLKKSSSCVKILKQVFNI